jgi:hypothetical protein
VSGRWSAIVAVAVSTFTSGVRAQDVSPSAEPRRSPQELESAVLGPDRAERRKAFWEAIDAGTLDERSWTRLLDARFPSDEEQEEALFFATYALARVGTSASLARVEEVLRRPPRLMVRSDDLGRDVPVFDYVTQATFARNRITGQLAITGARAVLNGLSEGERAARLVAWIMRPDEGFAQVRPSAASTATPSWWTMWVGDQLMAMGATGVRSVGAAANDSDDPHVRSRLWSSLERAVVNVPISAVADRLPSTDRERWLAGDASLRERVRRQVVEARGEVRPALVEVATLALQRRDLRSQDEPIFRVVRVYRVTEVEPALVALVRANQESSTTGLAALTLESLGTDSALDFIANWDGPLGPYPLTDIHAARLTEKFVQALERECETPWTPRFKRLARTIGASPLRAKTVDASRLEALLARARQASGDDPQRQRQGTEGIQALERTIQFVRDCAAEGRGR